MVRTATFTLALVGAFVALAGCGRAQPAGNAAAPPTQPPVPQADSAWVELTDRGAEARLITSADACPPLVIDGANVAMTTRGGPSPDFQVRVCQALLPKGARSASVGGRALPIPRAAPKRLVIFGDTGCRLKGEEIQNCDRAADWPFAQVARLAAAHDPDVVIHVGDYYYRESPCPAGKAGCAGSPWGDNWTTWDADFFAPAAPLLAAAPWVMARGNHEDCDRGGPGWFLLLDAASAPAACPADAAPMVVDLGGLALYVLDSSGTVDRKATAGPVAAFGAQLNLLKTHPPREPAWILTHRPVWGLVPVASAGPLGPLELPINATEQAAIHGHDLAGVQLVLSGHIHHFASFAFKGDRPAQMIVGTGGDIGEPGDTPRFLDGDVGIDGMEARRFGFDRYGFLVLDRTARGWSGAFYDIQDRPIVLCQLTGRALACKPAPRR
jgi:hypothetical protein